MEVFEPVLDYFDMQDAFVREYHSILTESISEMLGITNDFDVDRMADDVLYEISETGLGNW